jgi:enolase-phosphatase E1
VSPELTPGARRGVVLDIEGTTTPITFVTEVLFPYARTHLGRYLEEHTGDPAHESLLARLADEHAADRGRGEAVPSWVDQPPEAHRAAIAAYIGWLMDRDRKAEALKDLQGRIWEQGYARGDLRGDVFPDVAPALAGWRRQGVAIAVYSSGSVLAQQLLFRHSTAGDLTPFVQAHFDTTTGAKRDPHSYSRIAAALSLAAAGCLFLSDSTQELEAARTAGMRVRLAMRPGNAPVPADHGFETFDRLDDIGD